MTRTTQIHQPITFDYFQHQPITENGRSVWPSRKNDKNDIRRGKIQILWQESVFRRTIQNEGVILHELQDGYLCSNPHVEGELFPLRDFLIFALDD